MQFLVEGLPWREFITRKSFSLEWKWVVDFGDSEFRRICATVYPLKLVLIVPGIDLGTHIVMVYKWWEDDSWCDYRLRIGCKPSNTMTAADGGLVSFVSTFKCKTTTSPLILVVNPLTQACRELPPPHMCRVQPQMVQLVMDRDGKSYKVILVGYRNASPGCPAVQLFNSRSGVWMNIESSSGRFFGI